MFDRHVVNNNSSDASRLGMDMAVCEVDHGTKTINFAGAKNPLLFFQNGKLQELEADKYSVGGFSKDKKFTSKSLRFIDPVACYMSSDGFQDQFGGTNNKKFMLRNFKNLLLEIHTKPMFEQELILNKTINEWKGVNEQTDDMLVIGFKL